MAYVRDEEAKRRREAAKSELKEVNAAICRLKKGFATPELKAMRARARELHAIMATPSPPIA